MDGAVQFWNVVNGQCRCQCPEWFLLSRSRLGRGQQIAIYCANCRRSTRLFIRALAGPGVASKFKVGRHLIEGLKNPTVVLDKSALEVFPIRPMGVQESIQKAIANTAK